MQSSLYRCFSVRPHPFILFSALPFIAGFSRYPRLDPTHAISRSVLCHSQLLICCSSTDDTHTLAQINSASTHIHTHTHTHTKKKTTIQANIYAVPGYMHRHKLTGSGCKGMMAESETNTNTLTACFCTHTQEQHALSLAHTHMLLHLHTHAHICRHRFRAHREAAGSVARTQYTHRVITHKLCSHTHTHTINNIHKCSHVRDVEKYTHTAHFRTTHKVVVDQKYKQVYKHKPHFCIPLHIYTLKHTVLQITTPMRFFTTHTDPAWEQARAHIFWPLNSNTHILKHTPCVSHLQAPGLLDTSAAWQGVCCRYWCRSGWLFPPPALHSQSQKSEVCQAHLKRVREL